MGGEVELEGVGAEQFSAVTQPSGDVLDAKAIGHPRMVLERHCLEALGLRRRLEKCAPGERRSPDVHVIEI